MKSVYTELFVLELNGTAELNEKLSSSDVFEPKIAPFLYIFLLCFLKILYGSSFDLGHSP